MRPNVSAPAVLSAQDEELLLLTPEVWKEFELNEHKQAVINVMKCVKLRPEWSNV
ncbi:DNA repair protein, partial [Xanthomonas oryzae pv. oryzae]